MRLGQASAARLGQPQHHALGQDPPTGNAKTWPTIPTSGPGLVAVINRNESNNMNLKRKIITGVTAVVLATGAGLGLASCSTDATTATTAAASSATTGAPEPPQGAPGNGGGNTQLAESLAEALDLDTATVTTALTEVMAESGPPTGEPGSGENPMSSMAGALAEKLGVDEATVTTALNEAMPAPPADGAAPTSQPS